MFQELLPQYEIYYSCKANGEIGILKALKENDAKFEVASVEEYRNLKEIGVTNEKIICSCPIKTEKMLEFLYSNGCTYFVFDTLREYNKICSLAPKSKKIARISTIDIESGGIEFGLMSNEILQFNDIDGLTFHFINHDEEKIDRMFKIIQSILNYHLLYFVN